MAFSPSCQLGLGLSGDVCASLLQYFIIDEARLNDNSSLLVPTQRVKVASFCHFSTVSNLLCDKFSFAGFPHDRFQVTWSSPFETPFIFWIWCRWIDLYRLLVLLVVEFLSLQLVPYNLFKESYYSCLRLPALSLALLALRRTGKEFSYALTFFIVPAYCSFFTK